MARRGSSHTLHSCSIAAPTALPPVGKIKVFPFPLATAQPMRGCHSSANEKPPYFKLPPITPPLLCKREILPQFHRFAYPFAVAYLSQIVILCNSQTNPSALVKPLAVPFLRLTYPSLSLALPSSLSPGFPLPSSHYNRAAGVLLPKCSQRLHYSDILKPFQCLLENFQTGGCKQWSRLRFPEVSEMHVASTETLD